MHLLSKWKNPIRNPLRAQVLRLALSFLPFCAWAGTETGSIMLVNDSPFILTATIQGADGTFLGELTIQPGQQKTFSTNLTSTAYVRPGSPRLAITPYTVIWQCPSQDYYSMCTGVSPGSLCQANECPGLHFCSPKPDSQKEPPASTLKKGK